MATISSEFRSRLKRFDNDAYVDVLVQLRKPECAPQETRMAGSRRQDRIKSNKDFYLKGLEGIRGYLERCGLTGELNVNALGFVNHDGSGSLSLSKREIYGLATSKNVFSIMENQVIMGVEGITNE